MKQELTLRLLKTSGNSDAYMWLCEREQLDTMENISQSKKDNATMFLLPTMMDVHKYDPSEVAFPTPPEIHQTDDHGSFSLLDFNRDLRESNVRNLMQLTVKKFQMHKFPIIVDRNFNIIDGQHRFEACKRLGCPVYFIYDEDADTEDVSWKIVHDKNIAGSKHTIKDKIHMMYKEGHPLIVEAMKIRTECGKDLCSVSVVVRLLHSFGSSSGTTVVLNRGSFALNYKTETMWLLLFLRKLDFKFKWKDSFMLAVAVIWKRSRDAGMKIPCNKFLERLADNEYILKRQRNQAMYEENVQEAYNYKLTKNSRV